MNRRGFTLFELLVALAMSALIVGVLGASLYTAFHAEASAARVINANRGIDAALDGLGADLGDAVRPRRGTGNTLAGPFQGNNQSLSFYACGLEPGHRVQGNMRWIQIGTEPATNGSGLQLVRWVTTNLLATVTPTPAPDVLCAHVTDFSLSYFDGTNWDDHWDSTQTQPANALPLAVRVTLVVTPQAGTRPVQEERIVPLACAQPLQGLNLP